MHIKLLGRFFKKDKIAFCLLFFAGVLFRLIHITLPWWGDQDSNGAFLTFGAYNILKYGIFKTKLGLMISAGLSDPSRFIYYFHHPPLIVSWLAIFVAVLGYSETTARIAAIVLSLTASMFIFLTARRITDRSYSILALFFALLIPLDVYYGRLPTHFLMSYAFVCVSIYLYIRWIEQGGGGWFAGLIIFFVLASLSDWIAYFLPVSCVIYLIIADRRILQRRFWEHLFLLLLPFGCFFLHLCHAYLAGGIDTVADLFNAGEERVFFVDFFSRIVPLVERIVYWTCLYFTLPLIVLSLVWAVLAIKSWKLKKPPHNCEKQKFLLPIIPLTMSLLFFIAFPAFASVHVVSFFLLTPFFVFTSIHTLRYLSEILEKRKWIHTTILLFVILGFLSHSLFLITLRHSQQGGYLAAYATSIAMARNSDYCDTILTSFKINPWYYSFYADRSVVMGVDTIEKFNDEIEKSGYNVDLFMAVDNGLFLEMFPIIVENKSHFSDKNGFGIDGPLFDMLNENYQPSRSGFLVIYNLNEEKD